MSLSDSKAWDSTSVDYDQFSEEITVVFGKKGMVLCGLQDSLKKSSSTIEILDVAAGSGILGTRIAESASKNGYKVKILSTDFSEKMIEIGRKKITKDITDFIDMEVMDGQNLSISDSKFDYCFSIFGVFMFTNRIKGLQEMNRVLKKGGKIIVSAWIEIQTNSVFFEVLGKMGIQTPNQNVLNFGKEEVMIPELKEAGFQNIQTYKETSTCKYTFSDFWKFMSSNPFMQMMWKLAGDRKDEFNSITKEEILKKFSKDGVNLEFQSSALIGIAEK